MISTDQQYMMNPIWLGRLTSLARLARLIAEPASRTSSFLTETVNDLNTFLDDMQPEGSTVNWKKYRLAGDGLLSFARDVSRNEGPLLTRDRRDDVSLKGRA